MSPFKLDVMKDIYSLRHYERVSRTSILSPQPEQLWTTGHGPSLFFNCCTPSLPSHMILWPTYLSSLLCDLLLRAHDFLVDRTLYMLRIEEVQLFGLFIIVGGSRPLVRASKSWLLQFLIIKQNTDCFLEQWCSMNAQTLHSSPGQWPCCDDILIKLNFWSENYWTQKLFCRVCTHWLLLDWTGQISQMIWKLDYNLDPFSIAWAW